MHGLKKIERGLMLCVAADFLNCVRSLLDGDGFLRGKYFKDENRALDGRDSHQRNEFNSQWLPSAVNVSKPSGRVG